MEQNHKRSGTLRRPFEETTSRPKRQTLKSYGHVIGSTGFAKTIVQGTVQRQRKRERQRKRWGTTL